MKKIIMTGGGTAGHVMVNKVLIPELIKSGWQIIYIGSHKGIEMEMIESLDSVKYYGISTGKLRRYFSVQNFLDVFRILKGIIEGWWLIGKHKPNVVFSCGGYVSVPVMIGSKIRNVKSIIRETDYTIGLANRICMPLADKVCYTFKKELSHSKMINCGPIIRKNLIMGSKERGLQLLNFSGNKPIIMIQGGSQGSNRVNEVIRLCLKELLVSFDIIHLCGKGNIDESIDYVGYVQCEYAKEEMKDYYAAADIVVTRSGSNSLFECLLLSKPMVLLPLSRKISRGDQILNAKYAESLGVGIMILDEELSMQSLIDAIDAAKYLKLYGGVKNSSQELENNIATQLDIINEIASTTHI